MGAIWCEHWKNISFKSIFQVSIPFAEVGAESVFPWNSHFQFSKHLLRSSWSNNLSTNSSTTTMHFYVRWYFMFSLHIMHNMHNMDMGNQKEFFWVVSILNFNKCWNFGHFPTTVYASPLNFQHPANEIEHYKRSWNSSFCQFIGA